MTERATTVEKRRTLLTPSTKENLKRYWFKFRRNKLSLVGLIMVLLTLFLAFFGPLIVSYPEAIQGKVNLNEAFLPPSSDHWFGTDYIGCDIFSRCIGACNDAMLMTLVVLCIAVPLGVFLGLIAGYKKDTFIETLIMRTTDVFLALPPVIMALAIAALFEPTLTNAMLSITVIWWSWYCRQAYGQAAIIRSEYFVKSAELIGASKMHVIFREIMPNCLSPILTKMALDVGWVILIGATLSFVGLGQQPPTPSFGSMIQCAIAYMPTHWWILIFPCACIAFIILGFNFFGDGIRDMFDRGR